MVLVIVQFLISAGIIVVSGTYLSRFADEIAERTNLGRLLVGSILLAGATSLPELTVGISAVRAKMADLAFGDLIGACLFNVLMLALLDLTRRPRGQLLSRQAAGHALSGNVSAALASIVAISLLSRPLSASGELLGISYGLWFVVAGYLLGVRLVYFDQQAGRALAAAKELMEEPKEKLPVGKSILGFVAAAAVIVVTGPFLSESAGKIAELTGLGKTFVGTTLVAFSTTLPELVASLAALRMGAHDLAIGNVFGSNAFNMLLLVPLDAVQTGSILMEVSTNHAVSAIAAVIATQIVVLGQLYQVERRHFLIDPDATLVLVVVFGSLWMIYRLG